MSLRDSLRNATELQVAPPKACNPQLLGRLHATDRATPAQQRTAIPGRNLVSSATPPATGPQQEGLQACNSGQKLHVAFAKACNTQLGSLTAHRTGAALVKAINRCCSARCDDDANLAALIAECVALDAAGQADMLAHFSAEADRWERSCKGGRA